MKKTIFAVSIFAALVMSGCRPETRNQMLGIPDDAILLSTENFTGNDTKTSVSGTSVQWVGGDEIDFYVGTGSKQPREVVVSEGNAYVASALTGDDVIRGYYPAGLATENQTTDNPVVKLPAEYSCSVSDGRQVIALPMVGKAAAGATTIKFRHLTAAVNVMLKNSLGSALYVDSVVVIADVYRLNASEKYINWGYDDFNLTASSMGASSATKRVKVSFPTALVVAASSEDQSVQVPIMPIGEDSLTIKVYCHSETTNYLYSHKNASQAIALNQMLTAKLDLNTAGHMEEIVSGNVIDLSQYTGYGVQLVDANDGDILTGTPGKNVQCRIPDGATVTIRNVNATSKYLMLRAQGDANLIVSGTNKLTFSNGYTLVHVVEGSTLVIKEDNNNAVDDTLEVQSSTGNGAAIGSFNGDGGTCGNITINSGTIIATNTSTSSTGSAAIGCGAANCGTITINGGVVIAVGSAKSAGIGSRGSNNIACGAININGGRVEATGGSGAAGIGTGNYTTCSCGDITIKNTVTSVIATKGSGATASIGKGHASSTCGTVTIEDGANVTQN